jgi:sugar phosphate isomerase/epimerase
MELSARDLLKLGFGELIGLIAKLERKDLPCLGFNAYCPPEIKIAGPGFDSLSARDYAGKVLTFARMLGARHIGIGAPISRILPNGFPRDLAESQIREFFRVTVDVFAEYEIYVLVEPLGSCYCNFINTISEAAQIVKDEDHPYLAMLADFYNMEHSGEGNLDLSGYIPMVMHTHISDDADSPSKRDFLREDRFPVHKERIQRLYAAGYDRAVSLEIDVRADLRKAEVNLEFLRSQTAMFGCRE